jgi:hypothetical protein
VTLTPESSRDDDRSQVVQLRKGVGLVVFAREIRCDYPEPGLVTIYPTGSGVVSVTVTRDEIVPAPGDG